MLSGIIGGLFSATFLIAFGDGLRDWSIRLRTIAPPGHLLMLYDPREPPGSGATVVYNLYGVRDNDSFEGTFGRRNDDGTTDFDVSFRYKGFARDGQMYLSYAPIHGERFGAGQFQSVNRLTRDIFYGFVFGQVCKRAEGESKAIQRVLVGVVVRVDQRSEADRAAASILQPPLGSPDFKPLYDLDFSSRDCVGASPVKQGS